MEDTKQTEESTSLLDIIKLLLSKIKILILVVIYNNAPQLKHFREKYNLRALWEKIVPKKSDPSKQKDDEGAWDRVPTKIQMDELLSTDIIVTESVQDPDKGGQE